MTETTSAATPATNDVTWAVALKAPGGKKCLYYDQGWKIDEDNIDDFVRKQLCTQTWPNHLLYSDQSPVDKQGEAFAHAKGVVVWDSKTLGWLIHSAPLWPSTFIEQNGHQTIAPIPQAETEYGQSFVYLTMPVGRLPEVISQLQMSDVHMYGVEDNDNKWSRRKRAPAKKDALSTIKLSDTVTHVSKHRTWAQDLYADYLAPTLGPLIQETWTRPGLDPTTDVLNAEELAWPVGDIKYNEKQDHSKYGMAQSDDKPFTYIGDVNRMTSQKHRGGGGVIIQDAELCKAFRSLVTSTEWKKKDEHGNVV